MSVRRVRNGIDESFRGGGLKRGGTQVEVFHFLCHDLPRVGPGVKSALQQFPAYCDFVGCFRVKLSWMACNQFSGKEVGDYTRFW